MFTYCSELMAGHVAIELIMEYYYKLHMLGVPLNGPALLLGDNNSVILNMIVHSNPLKKKHNTITWHCIREVITCKIIVFTKINSKDNYSGMLTKPLPPVLFCHLVEPLHQALTIPPPPEQQEERLPDPNASL